MRRMNSDMILGLAVIILALVALLFWVPMDTGSGIAERVRGSYKIGDAFGPTVAFALLGLAGLILVLQARKGSTAEGLSYQDIGFIGMAFAIYFTALLLMRWTGPVLAGLFAEASYRELRDTLPWKYLGYVAGGTFMVAMTIMLASRRVSLGALVIGFVAALLMAMFYDLPFEDILLPPNGDV